MPTIEPLFLTTAQAHTLPADAADRGTDRYVAADDTGAGARAGAARGLPLPTIRQRILSTTSSYYVVSSIDARGRFADRSALRRLRWPAGTKITIHPTDTRIVINRDPEGTDAVTVQGHLRLPARVRHALRLSTGDRLLVAADIDAELLVAYPMPAIDAILAAAAATSDRDLP